MMTTTQHSHDRSVSLTVRPSPRRGGPPDVDVRLFDLLVGRLCGAGQVNDLVRYLRGEAVGDAFGFPALDGARPAVLRPRAGGGWTLSRGSLFGTLGVADGAWLVAALTDDVVESSFDEEDGVTEPTPEQVQAFRAGWEAADRRGEKGSRTVAGLRAVFALDAPETPMSPGYERRARALLDARIAVGPAPSSDASGMFQASALRGWRTEVQALAEWSLKGPDLADHAGALADRLDEARAAGRAAGVDEARRKAASAEREAREEGAADGMRKATDVLNQGVPPGALWDAALAFAARERKAKKGPRATGGEG